MSYLIKKDTKTNNIYYMEYNLDGYKFKPKKEVTLKVKEITVINTDMVDKILTIKFNAMFKKITSFVMQILYDDNSDESSTAFALSEIDRLKSILINNYQKFLTSQKKQTFIAKLNFLEQQLRMKIIMNYQKSAELDRPSRGR